MLQVGRIASTMSLLRIMWGHHHLGEKKQCLHIRVVHTATSRITLLQEMARATLSYTHTLDPLQVSLIISAILHFCSRLSLLIQAVGMNYQHIEKGPSKTELGLLHLPEILIMLQNANTLFWAFSINRAFLASYLVLCWSPMPWNGMNGGGRESFRIS